MPDTHATTCPATKVLVLYATREGQTEKIATRIASHLKAAGVTVQLVDARDSDRVERLRPAAFDLLVFGGSMHAGGIEAELRDFIHRHAAEIRERPRAFFLVLLSAATKDPSLRSTWLADAEKKLTAALAVAFDDIEMIAGALRYSQYPAPLRWLMRRIAAKAGGDTDTSRDHEYTDWAQVERYAERLLRPGTGSGGSPPTGS